MSHRGSDDDSGFFSDDDGEFYDATSMDGDEGPLHIPDSLKTALFAMDAAKDAHKPLTDDTTVITHGGESALAAPAPHGAAGNGYGASHDNDATTPPRAQPATTTAPVVSPVGGEMGAAQGPDMGGSPPARGDSVGAGVMRAGARPRVSTADAADESGNPMPFHPAAVGAVAGTPRGSSMDDGTPRQAPAAETGATGGAAAGGNGPIFAADGAGSATGAGAGAGAGGGDRSGGDVRRPIDPTAGYPPDVPEPTYFPDGSVDPATVHPSVAHLFLKDADSGKMYRIDRIGDNFFQELATFDTFLGLGERESGDEDGDAGSGSDSGADDGGGSTAKKVGGFLKSMFGKKAARAATAEKKEPDDFVKVHTTKKGVKELTKVMLCQHMHVHTGPVWTMKFSYDGQYLATAGQDTTVLVWKVSMFGSESDGDSTLSRSSSGSVNANPTTHSRRVPTLAEAAKAEARAASGRRRRRSSVPSGSSISGSSSAGSVDHSAKSDSGSAGAGGGASAGAGGGVHVPPPGASTGSDGLKLKGTPLFDHAPIRTYTGHSTHVVDLAWSRDYFLLSASMDSYVRLWHISRAQCLHKFQHPDCVTSVCFHPTEENYFLTGCFDKKLRVWNRQSGRVIMWQPTPVMVTAAAFNPNGRVVVAGLYNGQCVLYNVQSNGFAYHTQIDCRNRRGRLRKGRKVTGIVFINNGSEMLVTTNDSRCRLISLDDFSMTFKYGGLRNNNMQIKASCGSNGERVICGSENRHVYVWRTRHDLYTPSINPRLTGFKRNKNKSYEYFQAHDDVVTVALFAPDNLLPLRPPPPSDAGHMLMVTAGMKGDVRVFENVGAAEKL